MALIDAVNLCLAASALPDEPASWGDVSQWWRVSMPRAFSLIMWSDEASSFTGLRLIGAVPKAVTLADDDVDAVTPATDTLTVNGHAYHNGDGPVRLTTTGVLPFGLLGGVDYWVGVIGVNSVKLYASRETLMLGGSVASATPVDITSAGTGTHTIHGVAPAADSAYPAGTDRLRWCDCAQLGLTASGDVTLDKVRAMGQRFDHSFRVVAYALAGVVASGKMSASVHLERIQ